MPIEFFTSPSLDLLYARWWGVIDLEAFHTNFDTYLADALYSPGRPELIDLSGVTRIDMNFDQVRRMLRKVNEQAPGCKVTTRTVVWAPGDDAYAIGRMYEQLADFMGGIVVEIHRNEQDALRAYGLSDKSMQELMPGKDFVPFQPRDPS